MYCSYPHILFIDRGTRVRISPAPIKTQKKKKEIEIVRITITRLYYTVNTFQVDNLLFVVEDSMVLLAEASASTKMIEKKNL